MPDLNLERLKAVRSAILDNPDAHNQANWGERTACGTFLCQAGWACVVAGVELNWCSVGVNASGPVFRTDTTAEGEHISHKAQDLLGLTHDQADILFWAYSNEHSMDVLNALIAAAEKGENLSWEELEEI